MIASSNLSPPILTLLANTIPAREITAASDVDDHVARGLGNREASADRSGHWLLDQVNLPCTRVLSSLPDRPPFHLGDSGWNPDDDSGSNPKAAVARIVDEVPEHPRRDLKVSDHPVLHRSDRNDVARRSAEHLLCFLADRQHLFSTARVLLHRHDRGLVGNDPDAADVDQRICGT